MQFSLGVNYWPRSTATAMWRRFDAGEIREDFARIAALGLDTVRFFVRWDDFQPRPDVVDPVMLDRLARVVAAAGDARLRAMPTLFCGHMSGVNFLPEWALDRTSRRGRYRTIAGETESPFGIGDIYTGPVLEAQVYLARAVAERLSGHPAIAAWDLGHDFGSVHAPADAKVFAGEHSTVPAAEPEVAEWSRRLTAALRASAPIAVTAGTSARDLTHDRNLRFGSLCAPFGFASMQGTNVGLAFARNRRDPEAIPFLATIAASFSYKPVLVSGFGNPTCPPGKFSAFERFASEHEPPNQTISPDDGVFATYPCLTEDENAAYCRAVLARLHADGRLGAYWWCWTDYADDLRGEPPFDERPHEMTFGIVRADGSEKPVARALAAFASERRTVGREFDMPMIASTYYFRTLPASTKTLYDAYLRAVGERGE
jgi:hypothetical protein